MFHALLLLWSLLMALGINQIGGNGGNIVYQEDTDVAAAGDGVAGSYSIEDWYQKVLATGWKALDGVTPAIEKWAALFPIYWVHVGIVNGDGVLTGTTTWLQGRAIIIFDAGKTHSFSAVGLANRWMKTGQLQETAPGDPMGFDGSDITFGATTTIDGNVQIYGSNLTVKAAGVGQLTVRRASTSAAGDMVHVRMTNLSPGANSGFNVGTASIPFARARHIVFDSRGTNTQVTLFNVLDADDSETGGITAVRWNILNAYTFARNARFVGTPGTADVRGSGGGTDLVDALWSRAAAQVQLMTTIVRDWRTFSPVSQDVLTGTPILGDTLNLYDKNGALVIGPIVSDALGQFAFSLNTVTGIAVLNAVIARQTGTGAWVENGPFKAVYSKAAYVDTEVNFSWPRATGAFGDQLYGVFDVVPRRPITVTPITVLELSIDADTIETVFDSQVAA